MRPAGAGVFEIELSLLFGVRVVLEFRFELFEVVVDGFLHRDEDESEDHIAPFEMEDSGTEDAAAVGFGFNAEAPLSGLEVAGIASGAGELDNATANWIDVGYPVGHLAPGAIAGVGAGVSERVELKAYSEWSSGCDLGARNTTIPGSYIRHVAQVGPYVLRCPLDVDGGSKVHGI